MKIVYSWLKEFVDIDIPAHDVADALTSAGLEVASVQHYHIPHGVKVARVLEREKHPGADKLSLCKVDVGGSEPLQVVCGAPNVQAGMIVALATVGTVLGPEMTIKKAKIRGVESFGMLCSERELGISDDHSGIMELPAGYTLGEEVATYFPDDDVIEIEITPDRGDCLSILGVAREVSARYGLPLKETAKRPPENAADPVPEAMSVTIEAPGSCPRYMGRLVRGVTLGPSPEWMQRRLSLAGIRPISNVVDVTNYIMLHYGQPMHAFDYARLEGRQIRVRTAGCSQTFPTLDEVERALVPDDLLICDATRGVALAGIMGGAGSEITSSTRDVFLECAFFEPIGIRKTSKRLGLSTDSSYRFERGVDPDQGLVDALDTAAELIRELAGGAVASGRIDAYPEPLTKRQIAIRPSRTTRVLGLDFTGEQIIASLSSLGISCVQEHPDKITCVVPLFRHDLAIEEDLIEEVGRLYGYDNIPAAEHAPVSLRAQAPVVERTTDSVRNALSYSGLREIVTNSLTSEQDRAVLTPDRKPIALLNPLSPEMAQMRTTLAGSMLQVFAYNLNRKNENNRLFELGKVFWADGDGPAVERTYLGVAIGGTMWEPSWNSVPAPVDFYTLRGILEQFAMQVRVGPLGFSRCTDCPILGSAAACVAGEGGISGVAGEVRKGVLDHFGMKNTSVFFAEIDITDLLQSPLPHPHYSPLPRFPAVERDFCFVMAEKVSSADVVDAIRGVSAMIEEVRPFDLYRGDKLGPGRKSIAYGVRIRSQEKTLTDQEAEGISASIVRAAADRFNAELRS